MLGARLKAIAHKVPIGTKLADIGTDHGLIPIYLIKKGIATKVIGTDISLGSLKKAITTVEAEGLKNKIDLRLGSGLNVIEPGEVDTIIIAGMGGELIAKILGENPLLSSYAKRLILQPMSSQRELRKWLIKDGYKIIDESLVKEDRYIYEIIIATLGNQEVQRDIQYDIGFKLIENKDPLFEEFIMGKIKKTQRIIGELKRIETINSRKALAQFERELSEYKEAYGWFAE